MILDHANPIRLPPPIGPPAPVLERAGRRCDEHLDCDVADLKSILETGKLAIHPYDQDCEDYFGF